MRASTGTRPRFIVVSSSPGTSSRRICPCRRERPRSCGGFPRRCRTSGTLAPTLFVTACLARLTSFSRPGDSFSGFFIRSAAAFGFALVPELLAFSQGEFNLHSAVLEVHPRGDQGQALLLGLADELAKFLFVDEQLAGAQRRVVENVAMVVGSDVAVKQPKFAVLQQSVGVFQVGLSGPDRFDFGSGQGNPGLEFLQKEIVVGCDPVDGGIALSGCGGIAARV